LVYLLSILFYLCTVILSQVILEFCYIFCIFFVWLLTCEVHFYLKIINFLIIVLVLFVLNMKILFIFPSDIFDDDFDLLLFESAIFVL
jgi:hypothetical protein